ncbi:MAG: succinate dehydrogenase [Planctomycetota bacterium]|nr:succinate dehydrogenase [Planctomycetota bacterium]
MSATAAHAPSKSSFLERHYHLLRRLHSLTGVAPIGVFLIPHLTTNSSIVWGEVFNAKKYAELGAGSAGVATFQHEVNFIHDLPALIFIEIFVLWLPIAYHAILGVYFARSGRANTERYAYQANWRYTFQRVSGYLGVLFLFMHISSLRWGWTYGGIMPSFDADNAASSTALHLQGGFFPYFNAVFYLVCVLALVFHFANGLWTAGITWGLTISKQAQQRWGVVCAGIGMALAAAGVSAVVGFSTLDATKAEEIENKMQSEVAVLTEPAAPQ